MTRRSPFEPALPPALAYFDARDRLAADVRAGVVKLEPGELVDRLAVGAGLDRSQAADWAERFLKGLRRDVVRMM